ncbi:MAG: M23 family metallopeptidase [Spirochaetia bacterium]
MRQTRQLCFAMLFLVTLQGFAEDLVQEQIHELQRGETIYTLARRYGVSAETLLDYNSIADPTRLPVGAEIRIPGTYVVREGEYIYSIARKLGVDWLELLQSNGLDLDEVLRPGHVLLVPWAAHAGDPANRQPNDSFATAEDPVAPEVTESDDAATSVAVSAAAVSSVAMPSVQLIWPHPGEREPWNGRFRGVVMSGEPGDVFQSVTSGVVSYVGPFTSFGKVILVWAENGYLYGYAGADRVDVVQGQRVSNGTVLGSVGVSPAFRSARVFFTVWRNNRYVDPESAPRG